MFAIDSSFESQDRSVPMLGISYLQAALQNKGYYCERIDPFRKNYIFESDKVIKYIIDNNFDVVGFSILECNLELSIKIAKKLKEINPKITTLFGGIYATIKNEQLLDYQCIDVVMRGEGEKIIVDLLDDIENYGKLTNKIIGCTYKNLNGNRVISRDVQYIDNLNDNVYPNRDNCFEYSIIKVDGVEYHVIPVSSSRGCPYRCSFCSVCMSNSRWRKRSADDVINEIREIAETNKNFVVAFIDDNFFVDVERSMEIIRQLKVMGVKFIFATRVNQIIDAQDKLSEIKECGCEGIEIGLENGSNAMLKRFNKNTTAEENIMAVELLRKNNFKFAVDFITFDNETTIYELKENIDFLKKSGLWGYYPVFLYNKVIPYEGTAYFEKIGKFDYAIKDEKVERIYQTYMAFGKKYQKVLEKIYCKLNDKSNKTIEEKLDLLKVKTLPYDVFEIIVNECDNYQIGIVEQNISDLCKKYLGVEYVETGNCFIGKQE